MNYNYNTTQHNTTQHNTTQHVFKPLAIIFSITIVLVSSVFGIVGLSKSQKSNAQQYDTFNAIIGNNSTVLLKAGHLYKIELYGGNGGASTIQNSPNGVGLYGTYAQVYYNCPQDEMLYYTIGQNGNISTRSNDSGGSGYINGSNGSGNDNNGVFSGGGGGASAVSIGSPLSSTIADIVCGGGRGASGWDKDYKTTNGGAGGGTPYLNPDAFPDVTDKFPWAGANTIAVGNGDCGRLILTDYGTTTAKGDGTYIINENTSNILNITRETVENLTENNSTNTVNALDIVSYILHGITVGLVLFAIFRPRGIKTVKVSANPPKTSIH